MGAYLSEPVTEKVSTDDCNERLAVGASSMQGWRVSQEDAHSCKLDFDTNTSLFAVFDGHGGAEVAQFCSTNLPNRILEMDSYVKGNMAQALEDAFLNVDQSLITPEILDELKTMAGVTGRQSDQEDDEVDNLHAEANMPIDQLLARYRTNLITKENRGIFLRPSESEKAIEKTIEAGTSKNSDEKEIISITAGSSAGKDGGDCSNGLTNGEIPKKLSRFTSNILAPILRAARPNSLRDEEEEESEESDDDFEQSLTSSSDDDDENGEKESEESESENEEEEEEEEKEEENYVIGEKEEVGYDSGCTAVVALLRNDELYVANAGDSRCVVCRNGKAIEMSRDHKPEDELERKRIETAGGQVTPDGRVNGGLNLSRAIGDHSYKKKSDLDAKDQMISALPDIRTLTIDSQDEFMVVACDGIWNFMSSQGVIDFVRQRLTPERKKISTICEELFDNCLATDTFGDGTGCDNMTCVIVKFKWTNKRWSDSTLENENKRMKTDEN